MSRKSIASTVQYKEKCTSRLDRGTTVESCVLILLERDRPLTVVESKGKCRKTTVEHGWEVTELYCTRRSSDKFRVNKTVVYRGKQLVEWTASVGWRAFQ